QGVDLFPVDVDARNIESHFCETGTRYEADITRTHDCDFHHIMSKFLVGLAVHAPGDPRCERVACLVPCRRETLLHFHGFADRLPLHLLCEFAQAAYGGTRPAEGTEPAEVALRDAACRDQVEQAGHGRIEPSVIGWAAH